MNFRPLQTVLFCLLTAALTPVLRAQAPLSTHTLADALAAARYPLQVTDGGFADAGAPVLTAALDQARYVAIGEDHLTREIPRFTAAVCDEMAPRGLTALALETSPAAAQFVQNTFAQPDRLARMADLQKSFPDSVAFLNSRQENDLAAHCAATAKGNGFALWGLDQEFLGSAGWILSRMLATNPGPKARAAIVTMQTDEQASAAEATRNGDVKKLYLWGATDAQIALATAAIETDGTAATRQLFHELTESRSIYQERFVDVPTSNAHRARLLKQNFLADYRAAGGDARQQRVIVKFGDNHVYRGFNVIHQRDLGNFLAEQADASSSQSLHIMVMGIQGEHVSYTGYRQPLKYFNAVTDEDKGYLWLKSAIEPLQKAKKSDGTQEKDAWTLYDLRTLRFGKVADLSLEWERVIYGYDLLVLIPEVTPADLMR